MSEEMKKEDAFPLPPSVSADCSGPAPVTSEQASAPGTSEHNVTINDLITMVTQTSRREKQISSFIAVFCKQDPEILVACLLLWPLCPRDVGLDHVLALSVSSHCTTDTWSVTFH